MTHPETPQPAGKGITDYNLNLAVGLVAIIGAVLFVGWRVGSLLLTPAPERGRVFVAYFDDAAGVQAGDAVRIQNRRAGEVTDVALIEHEGRVQVRVEFEIRPGTSSPWLTHAGIPTDSRITIQRPRAFGRPRVNISIGESSDEFIPEGGEWKRTRGARSESDLDIWEADRQRFEKQADDLFAYFENEEFVKQIKDGVAGIADTFRQLESTVESAFKDVADLGKNIDAARESLDELRQGIAEARPGMKDSFESAAVSTNIDDREFDRVLDGIAGFVSVLDELERTIVQNRKQAEDPGLQRQIRQLRRQSTQLRASWLLAEQDPSRGGGTLSWRRSRQHYHGGESATEFTDWAYNQAKRGGAKFED